MEIETIYKDETMVVKAVWYAGKFLYTKTYFLDNEGFVKSTATTWNNGNVTTTGDVTVIKEDE